MTGPEQRDAVLARLRLRVDGSRRVEFVQTPRHALIDAGLLALARRGECAPWLTVEQTQRGAVLTFTGDTGRRVLYRLGRYVPGTGCHAIDQPD